MSPFRFRVTAAVIMAAGVVFLAGGFYGNSQVGEGQGALQGFSDAQNVTLSYNDKGQLTDRGTTEGAKEIMKLLTRTWQWPVNDDDMDPKDPVINTASEYMYQMATIAQHTLHGTQNVTLAERTEYDGDGDGTVPVGTVVYTPESWPTVDPEDPEADAVMAEVMDVLDGGEDAIFEAGTYAVPVNERYWTMFNRTHPLDGPARAGAWTGTVHGLFAELGVGATTASSLLMAQTLVYLVFGIGAVLLIIGGVLYWAAQDKKEGNSRSA